MDRDRIERLLEGVRAGKLGVDQALEQLRLDPLDRLAHATLDLQRAVRCGFPEVVYGPGKTPRQLVEIVTRLHRAEQTVLVTRIDPAAARTVVEAHPKAVHHEVARLLTLASGRRSKRRPGVAVVSAGTSDLPVAEEAAITAETMGHQVERIYDVGVAGVHRLLEHRKQLVQARVLVVVAGMEGALPSVIAGLTACPVIGVPTSTGYGASEGGRAALLSMLSSCAAGLTVVNIDNGFGAGYAASLINRQSRPPRKGTGK